MKKYPAIIFLLLITNVCFAQLSDDFFDGEFATNPTWFGTTAQFIVNSSKQLQLSNSTAGKSYLSIPFSTTTLDNYEWRFYVKQSFSPSGTNYGRVYLTSDQADLTQPLHGYYLQFGEAGSTDAIKLFIQNGTTSTLICNGTIGKIKASFSVNVKVTDSVGVWKVYADYSGGTNYTLEASGADNTYNSSSYFGVLCVYTASNATKFYYDDFFVGSSTQPDIFPPSVDSIKVISSNSLSIFFSETLDKTSAENNTNYSVNNLIGNPYSSTFQSDNKSVILSFSKNFQSGIQNQLSISNVKDTTGNVMLPITFPFMYFQNIPAKNKDLIFAEIFADATPQVSLPMQEYLEIYNRSSTTFNLSNWKLSDGSSTATFKDQIIFPNEYWIVCSSSNASLFSTYGNVIGVSNFPTLNNDGDKLTLRDANNLLIDSINYTLDWYRDTDKQEGGWSIEIIDVNNTCAEEENWTASDDESGGTPGRQNSVFANKPDLTPPQLISITPQSSTLLNLTFNEKLEKDLSNVSIIISPSVSISTKYFSDQSLRQIAVQLSDTLKFRELYTITINNLTDCAGNFIQQDFNQLSFALSEQADSLDILINEILFNPKPSGVDFVEVYNNSPKYINLKNWKLANLKNDSVVNAKIITSNDLIFPPSSYLVFTSDASMLSLQYPQSVQKNLYKTTLPSLPDDEGSIVMLNNQSSKIDYFVYSEKMHSPLIKDEEGVSLERISFSEITNDASNWKSATASANFATPGFINSNSRPESSVNENAIVIDPEIFSPSVVGKDFSKINYKFNQSGMAANVKILDAQGRLIKTLANNETLAYEGFFRWDGDRDDGSRARIGYYVVWFEVFDTSGFNKVFRKRTVIGR